jgi:hypothetical protein
VVLLLLLLLWVAVVVVLLVMMFVVSSKMSPRSNNQATTIVLVLLAISSLSQLAQACGPGRAGHRRASHRLRKYTPLVQREYVPNVSENTYGASGAPEGPIKRHDKRFKQLVQNWNPDIEFRDDERTGADRMMSQVS